MQSSNKKEDKDGGSSQGSRDETSEGAPLAGTVNLLLPVTTSSATVAANTAASAAFKDAYSKLCRGLREESSKSCKGGHQIIDECPFVATSA